MQTHESLHDFIIPKISDEDFETLALAVNTLGDDDDEKALPEEDIDFTEFDDAARAGLDKIDQIPANHTPNPNSIKDQIIYGHIPTNTPSLLEQAEVVLQADTPEGLATSWAALYLTLAFIASSHANRPVASTITIKSAYRFENDRNISISPIPTNRFTDPSALN